MIPRGRIFLMFATRLLLGYFAFAPALHGVVAAHLAMRMNSVDLNGFTLWGVLVTLPLSALFISACVVFAMDNPRKAYLGAVLSIYGHFLTYICLGFADFTLNILDLLGQPPEAMLVVQMAGMMMTGIALLCAWDSLSREEAKMVRNKQ
jgi:hypothetical protein